MLNIGVIGYGYWGPNIVRNFSALTGCKVVAVSDLRQDRLEFAKRIYPFIDVYRDASQLIARRDIDAVVIATSISSHFDLALKTLKSGKHVLIEKPFVQSVTQGKKLADLAAKKKLTLMVDHTFVYTGAVRKIYEIIKQKQIGDVYYYDSVRVNLGLFQHDMNVLWDLAVHDISIIDYIFKNKPKSVSATGTSHISRQPHNIAYLTLFFDNSLIAHVNVNWLAPVKVRRTLIGGSKKMIVYDDIEPSEKVKVYDSGVKFENNKKNIYKMFVSYRTGDVWVPKLELTEALTTMGSHFIECVERGKKPITSAESGLRVMNIMEKATLSMLNNGKLIKL